MDRKAKLAASATLIFVVLTVGIGITLVSAYELPETNYLALGMLLHDQNGGTTTSITGLDSKTLTRIGDGALTLKEIPVIKDKLQNTLNQGFLKWTKQNSIRFTLLNATSETVTPLFFEFLEDCPAYREVLKLYDRLLAQENDFKMQQITKTIVAMDVNYVVRNGDLLKEWNTTTESNGTTYTHMFKEYSMNVNGTTLTVVKVTVISSDGTVITDPYLYVHKVDLFYLQFVVISWWPYYGIWVPVYYGYDIYHYMRYGNENPSYSESALFLGEVYNQLVENPRATLSTVSGVLSSAAVIAYFIPVVGQAASLALGTLSAILYVAGVAVGAAGNIIYNEYLYSAEYNLARNSTFGVCQMGRYHLVLSYSPYESLSWCNFHVVYCDGGVKQVLPVTGVYYMTSNQASIFANYFIAINNAVGFEHWVWLGYYVPISFVV
ncbi:MAG: hypothetical protein ACTSP1_10600 [Candidatus Freyarchaeota archaeon]